MGRKYRHLMKEERDIIAVLKAEGLGCSAIARNTGIEHAKGKYLTFLDSDDWFTPSAIEMQVNMLETTGADVCYGDWCDVYENPVFTHQSNELFSAAPMSDPIEALLGDKWCPNFCYLLRRDAVVNVGGWNNDYKALQDRDFVVRIAFNRSRFVHYKGVVGYYFQHHEYRVSRSNRIRWLTFMKRHIFDSARWLTLNNEWNKERRHAIALSLFRHAQRYFGIDKNQFQECLKKTIEILPDFNAPRKYYRILVAILGYYRAETIRRIILKIFFRNKM